MTMTRFYLHYLEQCGNMSNQCSESKRISYAFHLSIRCAIEVAFALSCTGRTHFPTVNTLHADFGFLSCVIPRVVDALFIVFGCSSFSIFVVFVWPIVVGLAGLGFFVAAKYPAYVFRICVTFVSNRKGCMVGKGLSPKTLCVLLCVPRLSSRKLSPNTWEKVFL